MNVSNYVYGSNTLKFDDVIGVTLNEYTHRKSSSGSTSGSILNTQRKGKSNEKSLPQPSQWQQASLQYRETPTYQSNRKGQQHTNQNRIPLLRQPSDIKLGILQPEVFTFCSSGSFETGRVVKTSCIVLRSVRHYLVFLYRLRCPMSQCLAVFQPGPGTFIIGFQCSEIIEPRNTIKNSKKEG